MTPVRTFSLKQCSIRVLHNFSFHVADEGPVKEWGLWYRAPTQDDLVSSPSDGSSMTSSPIRSSVSGPAVKGTVFIVVSKKNEHQKYTVFIPDRVEGAPSSEQYCQSDSPIHTSFLIRDRSIQRALMAHPTRGMDNSTLHERWWIPNHPLFKDVLHSMTENMEIPGLGAQSLPTSVRAMPKDDEVMKASAVIVQGESRVPNKTGDRKKCAHAVTSSIVDLAAADRAVFEMVMPQLQTILKNAQTVRKTKSSRVSAAKATLQANNLETPIVPEAVQRMNADDINKANPNNRIRKKRKPGRAKESQSQGHSDQPRRKKRKPVQTSSGNVQPAFQAEYEDFLEFKRFKAAAEARGDTHA